MSTLAERLDALPTPWKPEAGDRLIGEVIGRRTRHDGPFGEYEIIDILVDVPGSTETGGTPIPNSEARSWHAYGTVPAGEIREQDPRLGDRMAVKSFGVAKSRDGNEYANWRVVVEKAQAQPTIVDPPPAEDLDPPFGDDPLF